MSLTPLHLNPRTLSVPRASDGRWYSDGRAEPNPNVPASWQDALDAVIASGGTNEQPLIDWYEANTGHEVNIAVGDLTFIDDFVSADTDGQVIENLDITGGISVKAHNVTIRNCRVRGYRGGTGGSQIKFDEDIGPQNTLIQHVTFDVSGVEPPEQNIHAIRAWAGTTPENRPVVEYCRVFHGPRSGFSTSWPIEYRFNYIEYLDSDWEGHGRGVSSNSSDCHIHHNMVKGNTGSAAFGMYFDRNREPLVDGVPYVRRTTFEYNIGLNHDVDYHWQAGNRDSEYEIEDIIVRNNYWTIYTKPSDGDPTRDATPTIIGFVADTPGSVVEPNYWLDGAIDDPRPPPDGWPAE